MLAQLAGAGGMPPGMGAQTIEEIRIYEEKESA
jgi:hypothetical protein